MNDHHWSYNGIIDPEKYFGFVYTIINNINNKRYIGCKIFKFKHGKKIKESDWKDYTGSNKTLNRDIGLYGKDKFTFEIIELIKERKMLKYREAMKIFEHNAIFNDMYYNEYIQVRLRNRK